MIPVAYMEYYADNFITVTEMTITTMIIMTIRLTRNEIDNQISARTPRNVDMEFGQVFHCRPRRIYTHAPSLTRATSFIPTCEWHTKRNEIVPTQLDNKRLPLSE